MAGFLPTTSLAEASSELDTERNCLGAGTGFVIRISWAIELGRNGWGETNVRFWIPLKLLARSFTLMSTSLAGSFSFSHSESFSLSIGAGGGVMGGGTAEVLLLRRAHKLLSSLSSSADSIPLLATLLVGLRKKCLGAGTGFGEMPDLSDLLNSTTSSFSSTESAFCRVTCCSFSLERSFSGFFESSDLEGFLFANKSSYSGLITSSLGSSLFPFPSRKALLVRPLWLTLAASSSSLKSS